jgi:two-component system, sensor histidine kinase LadS
MRKLWLIALLFACNVLLPAAAAVGQAMPIVVSHLVQLTQPLAMGVRENLPLERTLQQVAAESTQLFVPFDANTTYALEAQRPLWLHFRLLAQDPPSPSGWTLEFPKPYIDRIEFYHRDGRGGWAMQAAGDTIANTQWPQQGLNPRFELPPLAAGEHDFYVRVVHALPLHFSAHLQPTNAATVAHQNTFLVVGLLLGLMALMFALSCVLAVAYRDGIYAWYALYVALAFLGAASFMGIANYAFWPQSAWWPDIAIKVFVMAAMGAQLQFCRAMFITPASTPWMNRLVSAVIALNVLAVGLYIAIDTVALRLLLVALACAPCGLLMVALVARALHQGSKIAKLWLLAYMPLLVIIPMGLLEHLGRVALPWLPYFMPMYALVFEVPILLVALHWHAKTRHAKEVRASTLAATDPLTGFLAADAFRPVFAKLWQQAQTSQRDIAVAYVEVTQLDADKKPVSSPDAKAGTLRSVRLLRTVAREQDTVARLDDGLFALLMPSLSEGERLTALLARLVALSRMGEDGRQELSVRLRIVASSRRSFEGTTNQLDRAMRQLLKGAAAGWKRPIRFVEKRQSQVMDSQAMNDLWDQALAAKPVASLP